MTLSWQDRYDSARPTYTRVNDRKFADLEAGTTILIPSPSDIEDEIGRLDRNRTIDLTGLRDRLAERHGADGTCPVMCGMNLRIVAEVVWEALDAGTSTDEVTPVWNAVDPKSKLASKLAGGPSRIESLRRSSAAEG